MEARADVAATGIGPARPGGARKPPDARPRRVIKVDRETAIEGLTLAGELSDEEAKGVAG
jgi:hypothetical protein